MIIVGAGMAGLLAAAMLRDSVTEMFEASTAIPHNHSAVLRFKTPIVGDTLNIPFKPVKVLKAVLTHRNPVADALSYSIKTNGNARLRSILSADGAVSERFIAPRDLISQMIRRTSAPINLGARFEFGALRHATGDSAPVISTVPMNALMNALGWKPHSKFEHRMGINLVVKLKEQVDAYCTLYVPDPSMPFARISLTGNELVAECYSDWFSEHVGEPEAIGACELLGLPESLIVSIEARVQRYAKILPIDEDERRQFIVWASQEHGIFSVGRYATWRPGLLLDDVVNDIRVVQRLARQGNSELYRHLKKVS